MTNIIAIDGPASAGKSAIAKRISHKLKAPVLFSGRLYRAVAVEMINRNISYEDNKAILKCINRIEDNMESKNLYTSEVDRLSSIISTKEFLRDRLKKFQKSFPKLKAKRKKFAIVEGRDIGTIIFPNAKYKFFMWASTEIRARRRFLQVKKNGGNSSFKEILNEISHRDHKDLNRKIAPLKPAVNSVLLDTTNLDIEQALNNVLKIIKN